MGKVEPAAAAAANEQVFLQPKSKVAGALLMVVLAALPSVWLGSQGNPFGYPAAALFALIAFALLALLLSPKQPALRVRDDGFETVALFGGGFYPWDVVQSITPSKMMRAPVLGITLDASRHDVGRMGRQYEKQYGWHLPLPDGYGTPMGEIHAAMQRRLDAHRVRRAVAAAAARR